MTPSRFPQSNRILGPPDSLDDCGHLHVFTDGERCISCWRPSVDELADIAAGKPIWVSVRSGATQSPIALFTSDPFELTQ